MNLTVMRDGSERIRYSDPTIPIYLSRGDLKGLSNMSALCHWHEDVEFLMALSGHLTYNVNGTPVSVEEGDAIFINARHMHYGFSADGTDCLYICITFRPQLLCVSEEVTNRYILPILTSPQLAYMVFRAEQQEHKPLLNAIKQIDAACQHPQPGYELQALSSVFSLWNGIFQMAQAQIGHTAADSVSLMPQKQMLQYIRTHYRERLTVDAIAAAGGVCRTKCCQIFRQYLGRTPNSYLNSFRLEKGMELLKSTSMTVAEIADACGFSSASYFTELFTREKGCSPRAYRNSI